MITNYDALAGKLIEGKPIGRCPTCGRNALITLRKDGQFSAQHSDGQRCSGTVANPMPIALAAALRGVTVQTLYHAIQRKQLSATVFTLLPNRQFIAPADFNSWCASIIVGWRKGKARSSKIQTALKGGEPID